MSDLREELWLVGRRDTLDVCDVPSVVADWLVSDATVERMARALYEHGEPPPWTWGGAKPHTRKFFIDNARAGLAALAAALGPEEGGER